jgi:hypothetical protein
MLRFSGYHDGSLGSFGKDFTLPREGIEVISNYVYFSLTGNLT